jgi:transposase
MDLSFKELLTMNSTQARRRLLETYWKTNSISETARRWKTSRQVVRKWVRRYEQAPTDDLRELSRRPRTSPRHVSAHIEQIVVDARKTTHYGRARLALYLWRTQHLQLSSHTIRHILRRHGFHRQKRTRRVFYPAHWAWEHTGPFSLVQVDVKDILDKDSLGTERWQHIRSTQLPRYQWTFCEASTRLRFLCYSRYLNRTNGIAFFLLLMTYLRSLGVTTPIAWQTDWGEEFGGSNPTMLARLQQIYFTPLNARLVKIPKGRKEYNGRVERSHRTDDEEFYLPLLLSISNEEDLLRRAAAWVHYYNVHRPHSGHHMNGATPLERLHLLSYTHITRYNLFPPIMLDNIAFSIAHPYPGNDLLAHYNTQSTIESRRWYKSKSPTSCGNRAFK